MRLTAQRFLIAILLVFSFVIIAQDTVRENTNYRWQTPSGSSDEKQSGKYYYIGLQANQLLRQLLGSAGGGDNPFTLTYSFNSVATGRGMSFGLGFSTRKMEDKDKAINLTRTTKSNDLAFRIGYDVKKSIGKQWIAGYAFDAIRDGGKSETNTSFGGGGVNDTKTTTKTNGFGIGLRLSLLFHVSEKIYLGTESGLTFMANKTISDTEIPNVPDNPETELIDNSLALTVPSTLFLIIRF
jgi:hypothetical protein